MPPGLRPSEPRICHCGSLLPSHGGRALLVKVPPTPERRDPGRRHRDSRGGPPNAPADPAERLDVVVTQFLRLIVETEPAQRTMLRLSLDPDPAGRGPLPLRQDRAIGWIAQALEQLHGRLTEGELHRLVLAVRSAIGIEALVWLTDIAGLSRDDAAATMRWSAQALLTAAVTSGPPPVLFPSPQPRTWRKDWQTSRATPCDHERWSPAAHTRWRVPHGPACATLSGQSLRSSWSLVVQQWGYEPCRGQRRARPSRADRPSRTTTPVTMRGRSDSRPATTSVGPVSLWRSAPLVWAWASGRSRCGLAVSAPATRCPVPPPPTLMGKGSPGDPKTSTTVTAREALQAPAQLERPVPLRTRCPPRAPRVEYCNPPDS